MNLFILAALVALVSVWYNRRLAGVYAAEYERRLTLFLEEKNMDAPYGISGSVTRSRFERVADLAANFPSIVLTTVALLEIRPFSTSALAAGVLFVSAMSMTLGMVLSDNPQGVRPKGMVIKKPIFLDVSPWTLTLIALNSLGLVLVLVFPSLVVAE